MRRQCLSSPRMTLIFKICIRFSPFVLILYGVYFVIILNDIPQTWPRNQTRDVTKLIQPKDENTFTIVPNSICDDMKKEFLLLIVVTSAVQNSEKRQIIRDTWGKKINDDIKLIFLVGEPSNDINLQTKVFNEQQEMGDLLQGTFIDSYYNLTIKSLFMLKWFNSSCVKRRVKYLMKVDDDVYVNVQELENMVNENKKLNMLIGSIHCGAQPMTHGKWYAPPHMLTEIQKNTYPNFLSGTAYVMSSSTAEALYKTSITVPAFHLEDVYITGILPTYYNLFLYKNTLEAQLSSNQESSIHDKEIHPTNDGRFHINKVKNDPCQYASLISSHELEPLEFLQVHKQLENLKTDYCRKRYIPQDTYGKDTYEKIHTSYKTNKFCTPKSTMLWGKGECCGYIEYYLNNWM